ncbi:DoxX family membrane protein [Actinoplanes derwentensis]|uniref:Thiosulfate dehydrogenase [quinone] large subunit n=1 Tax=Actinoplanes derwentensis TaxID=113562 RepID=A0A1H1QRY3_9ACTN|nr:DoxX family membrane protein [Actinoplanes derwentensis]GID89347.1 membrane protein [Actinoplanes derwentensis]SDS26252.1 thiosulfate dehydrogenase [quinone] large subunit [Actinoplanes derwentensis]
MATTTRHNVVQLEETEKAATPGSILTHPAARLLAVLRIATGFVFLWAFLDKLLGLGYSTAAERSWINGGSPTKGFLSGVEVGPFQDVFRGIAGAPWADWMFMLGLLGVGVALILGIGLRIAAGAAALMMAFMWLAEWPPAQQTAGGEATRSSNPLVDYHVVYGIGATVLALTYAGHTWGLGRWWASLPIVQKNRWLI